MRLNKILKNTLLVLTACLVLSACATKKEVATDIKGQMQGDVYTGTDTVEYLADGVPDRVFFATNESILTTASRETLRAQAAWLRKNPNINVVLEQHLYLDSFLTKLLELLRFLLMQLLRSTHLLQRKLCLEHHQLNIQPCLFLCKHHLAFDL